MAASEADTRPDVLKAIGADTDALGFIMSCEESVGRLLRLLAAAKPGGRFLELGPGTGVGAAWLLAGMDEHAALDTLDSDPACLEVARHHHDADPRVTIIEADGGAWLAGRVGRSGDAPAYDLMFADTWPGKFTHRDEALSLVAPGGFYVVDGLAHQPKGAVPTGHHLAVEELVEDLESRPG